MKKVVIIVMALTFALSAGVVIAKVTCTVDSVNGDKVIMTCSGAGELQPGDSVSVKKAKTKALEGC